MPIHRWPRNWREAAWRKPLPAAGHLLHGLPRPPRARGRSERAPAELVYGVQAAQTPGISEKRRNRLLLKQTLLRDIWGEDVQKKDLGFRLDITDEARALMEERMILDTDVQQVMQRYRASGEAVLENESGLLVTRARLGNAPSGRNSPRSRTATPSAAFTATA